MNGETYNEKFSSAKTEALFVALTVVFLMLFVLRWLERVDNHLPVHDRIFPVLGVQLPNS
jgi:hypothetical protein